MGMVKGPVAALLSAALLASGCSIHKGYRWVHAKTEQEDVVRHERCTASARLVGNQVATLQIWCEQQVETTVVEIWQQMERRKRMTGFWWAFGGTVGFLTLFILLVIAAANSDGGSGGGGSSWDWDD